MATESVNDPSASPGLCDSGESKTSNDFSIGQLDGFTQCVCAESAVLGALHDDSGREVAGCEHSPTQLNQYRYGVAKQAGMTMEQLDDLEQLILRELATPIDFEEMMSGGKLRQLPAGKYLILGSAIDLPTHVFTQSSNRYFCPADNGIVLEFAAIPRRPKWFRGL
ncbi:MAG: hypothetical protein SGJ20_11025 [Planctomycetota bacterium]|nr:hypothetical protein [Planctomycetota bacterium]